MNNDKYSNIENNEPQQNNEENNEHYINGPLIIKQNPFQRNLPLNIKINDLQKQLNLKENIIKSKEKEINSLKNDKKSLENEVEKLESKLQEKETEIEEIKKKYSELEKNHNDYYLKYEGVINQFDKIGNKNEKLTEKLKDLQNVEKQNNILEQENSKLTDLINKGETKIKFLDKSAEEYYDTIIGINSINSIRNEGWEIKYNPERKEIYQKIINEETIKIGVLGLNNVGKSYLLSKIANTEIPIGYSLETKGISIKYSQGEKGEEKGICILDSAGFETPLLKNEENPKLKDNNCTNKYENKEKENENKAQQLEKENEIFDEMMKFNKEEEELSKDKAQTERFIEHLIISLSDMIILVVGKLTRTEQRLITRIKNMAKNNDNRIRSIIIVHNLSHYNKKREVENHINNFLLRSATFKLLKKTVLGIKNYEDRVYYVEEFDKKSNIEVFHYIMAKEGTEAGNEYNNLTMELIKHQYNSLNQRNGIDIPEQIKKLFCKLSNDILDEKIEIDQLETIDENKIKLKKVGPNKNKSIIALNNFKIQNAYVDQDGNYLQSKERFEPKYSLYLYREYQDDDDDDEDFENYLLLRIEIPGNLKRLTARSTNKDEKYKGIIIKGYKEKDIIPEQSKKNFVQIYDNRCYEEISYFIELKGNINLNKNHAIDKTEIYEIQFNKNNREKYFKKNSKIIEVRDQKKEDKIVE